MILKKIKGSILLISTIMSLIIPSGITLLASSTVSAADNIQMGVCQGVNNAATGSNDTSCGTAGSGTTNLSTLATHIINIFSIIVGIVAVIMIIYGGFRYITSGGASERVGGAKNTLIYAIIGLIIVALAQLIVHFVLNNATTGTSGLGS